MADQSPTLPAPTPEQRRVARENYDRASQVAATGNNDYAVKLLLTACRLDPGQLLFRMALRKAQKARHKNNLRGAALSSITTAPLRARLKTHKARSEHTKVLEVGEEILTANPWDLGAQMDMADAADALGLLDLAIWSLDQAMQKDANDLGLNKALARLFEKKGDFRRAIFLWEKVRQAAPSDQEATHKAKNLAASETIQRGQYEGDGSAVHRALQTQNAGGPTPSAVPQDRTAREVAPLLAKVEADPTEPGPYLQAAALYRRAGDTEKARDLLTRGLGATGQHWQIVLELAELDLDPVRRNLALTEERLRSTPVPADADALRQMRLKLLREINSRELDVFRMKTDRFPSDASHRLELGIRLLRAARIDEAITELQQARRDSRLLWKALLYLGHCFKQRNNWRLAQRNFEEALQNLPAGEEGSRKDILYQLANGFAGAGDLARAVDLAHELANLDFGYKDIGKLMDEWERRLQEA